MLKFLQARDPRWVGIPFLARYDPEATWLDDLEPALGARQFFFERADGQSPRETDQRIAGSLTPLELG